MLKNEIRHVNEHGITFQEYRFNEYKNQIEKIAFYLGHETVAMREFKGIACVSGKAEIKQNDGNILMAFIENWIKVNGGWKMQF
ncbi:hypothetical protein ACSLO2_27265, partial [Escherichia coli]